MIFSILYLKSDNLLEHKGTGFVVNKKGLFISAGHVIIKYLEKLDRLYISFPSKEEPSPLYKFRILYYEHFNLTEADTPEEIKRKNLPNREDLLIGRIFKYRDTTHFKLRRKRPLETEQLTAKGLITTGQKEFPIINEMVDLRTLDLIPQPTPIRRREFSIVSNIDEDYQKDISKVSREKFYNNCMWLKNPIGFGSSGGPVIDSNNMVVGIISSGKSIVNCLNIICSKYIRNKYKQI
jgi:hypothetical protein